MNRRLLRLSAVSLGVTTVCCLWIVGPIVSTSHYALYHWSGSASALFIPPLADFLLVWFFVTLILLAGQRPGRRSVCIWGGIILILPCAFLKNLSLLTKLDYSPWVSRFLLGLSVAALFFLLMRWRDSYQRTFERIQKLAVTVLCSIAICGTLILIQLVWFGWQARSFNAACTLHSKTGSDAAFKVIHPRIIWILMDELSYQQVYGKRLQGLSLPAFDRLAAQATVFTHAVPAGYMTELVVPSLISGLKIDKIQPLADGRHLMIHRSGEKTWQNFSQHATIFQDAIDAGYSTAVVGWYIPYCRILPGVLDRCTWMFGGAVSNRSLPQASIIKNMLQPMTSFIVTDHLQAVLTHQPRAVGVDSKLHVTDYQGLLASADQLLQDPSFDFLLIHMPIPHPGGIYSRSTRSLVTENSDYIDNLALADTYLAHVQSLLESNGQWDSSTVVIMGDHSWRTPLWSTLPGWTEEEEMASDGGMFDDRPVYIVKTPYQKTGAQIDEPFFAVDTRMLLDAFLKQKINSADTLSKWVRDLARDRSK